MPEPVASVCTVPIFVSSMRTSTQVFGVRCVNETSSRESSRTELPEEGDGWFVAGAYDGAGGLCRGSVTNRHRGDEDPAVRQLHRDREGAGVAPGV